MSFGRLLAAVAVAASALLAVPAAHAAEPDAQQDEWVIESVARPDDVWDQTDWAWDPEFPVIPHPFHGEDNQRWHIGDDNTIRDVKHEWCLTSIDGRLAGRDCDGSEEQRWVGDSPDNYHTWQFELGSTGECITHNGVYQELVLARCETERVDQRWIIRR